MAIEWKGTEVLDVSGMTIKTGTYTGTDGIPTPFSSELIEKIFNKISKPVPFYFTHQQGQNGERIKIGYAHKFGLDRASNELHYKSFIFEDGVKTQIAHFGMDSTSAEIDFVYENGMPTDGTLVGIALCSNPAFDGTGIRVAAAKFAKQQLGDKNMAEPTESSKVKLFASSKAGVERYLLEIGATPADIESLWSVVQMKSFGSASVPTGTGNNGPKIEEEEAGDTMAENKQSKVADGPGIVPKAEGTGYKAKYEQASADLTAMTTKATEFESKYNALMGGQVSGMCNELKNLGFSEPEKLIEGLPVDQQVVMLSRVKENFAKGTPPSTPPNLGSVPPSDSSGAAFEKALAQLGVSAEYERLATKFPDKVGKVGTGKAGQADNMPC